MRTDASYSKLQWKETLGKKIKLLKFSVVNNSSPSVAAVWFLQGLEYFISDAITNIKIPSHTDRWHNCVHLLHHLDCFVNCSRVKQIDPQHVHG